MKILDPGHRYVLDQLDTSNDPASRPGDYLVLRFVKRVGDKFPGNEPPGYAGTTTQEVLRVLINRTKYVDDQIQDEANLNVIHHLREAIAHLEIRAARRRNDQAAVTKIVFGVNNDIENWPVCAKCGHVLCGEHL